MPNPEHNAKGDISLQLDPKANDANADIGLALSLPPDSTAPRYTYSTIGRYRSAAQCNRLPALIFVDQNRNRQHALCRHGDLLA